ncbi:MAG: hypothetical protein EOO52_01635 [Gammaproteobacteria bacterium]|nr:MAG: hypothetical protein EOO52_01635 [Gammaproteobacteria bacterium]
MSDQWKAKVMTIAGKPVAMVDVTITRTIMIDADAYEKINGTLRRGEGDDKSGLSEVADFYQLASTLPPESRQFLVVPWTDAESKKIGLSSFANILRVFEHRVYWRVEGSAAKGFRGIFNIGGNDHITDLSEQALPAFDLQTADTRAEALKSFNAGELTQDEKDNVDYICDTFGQTSLNCLGAYQAHAAMLRERDRQQREQKEREDRIRDREMNEKGDYVGDFPDGFEDKYGDRA